MAEVPSVVVLATWVAVASVFFVISVMNPVPRISSLSHSRADLREELDAGVVSERREELVFLHRREEDMCEAMPTEDVVQVVTKLWMLREMTKARRTIACAYWTAKRTGDVQRAASLDELFLAHVKKQVADYRSCTFIIFRNQEVPGCARESGRTDV